MINSVFIVDDHPFICSGIKAYLRANGYVIAGVAEDGTSVIADVGLHRPDLVIMDLNIPGRDGMQVIESLKRINDQQKIIVLTASESEFHMQRCLMLGVDGYLYKSHDTAQLLQAIRTIDKGVKFYPNSSSVEAKNLHPESEKLMSLSRRELMVLRKLAAGYSNKEIALQLSLSNKTISTYKIKILRKLGIKSVVDINEVAKRNYLV
ncbi:response regulator [Mixta tenebrionis]|uniref:Response regulator transcription factor n=1 Tax=Mixta tenebrionis TaxID=2562439 RepID=A0A506V354_9GAMM|nr:MULTISPECIES: response regulator transcription factor [Mixta]QHM74215.1 Virulence factors putative positive transcription regulator BvgA [Mixta theicola]TPW39770.1 response regulator transcription factor [Mixta tenebrionis]